VTPCVTPQHRCLGLSHRTLLLAWQRARQLEAGCESKGSGAPGGSDRSAGRQGPRARGRGGPQAARGRARPALAHNSRLQRGEGAATVATTKTRPRGVKIAVRGCTADEQGAGPASGQKEGAGWVGVKPGWARLLRPGGRPSKAQVLLGGCCCLLESTQWGWCGGGPRGGAAARVRARAARGRVLGLTEARLRSAGVAGSGVGGRRCRPLTVTREYPRAGSARCRR
jgi:hypothetical protein